MKFMVITFDGKHGLVMMRQTSTEGVIRDDAYMFDPGTSGGFMKKQRQVIE